MKPWRRSKRPAASKQPSLPGLFPPHKSRRLTTPHEQALDLARVRIAAIFCVFALAWLAIAGRLTELTVFSEPPDLAAAQPASDGIASRADIADRNGVVLATSLPTVTLCADSPRLLDPADAEKRLMEALPELDRKKLDEALYSDKHCAVIIRNMTPRQSYEVNKLGIAGLEFQPSERRIYPAGNVAAHEVGYTDIDNKGLAGAEEAFNSQLEEQQEPVTLAMDLRLQTILRGELANAMDQFHAQAAGGLIMDITTGEILSMVSLPDFDPAHPGNASDEARFNRETLGVYEMGSTFKIFTAAMALDSGLIHPGDTFDTVHPIEVGHQTIKDFEPEHRWLNVAEIVTHSSNIGAARMAERLGGARQRAFLARLGLTEKEKFELPEIGAPLLPSAKDWSDATTMTVAFGHGIAVNAVQLAAAIATVVNNGVPVHPTLLRVSKPPEPDTEDRVISARTSAQMRALMRLVVTRGTAKIANIPGYLIGGKTGTADKNVNGHYVKNARLSSFVGVFPLNAPHYLVFAMLDDPKGNAKTYGFATGGWVAAPVVAHVVAQMGPLLDIPPLDSDMEATAERQVLKALGPQLVDGLPVDEGSNYAANESDSVQ